MSSGVDGIGMTSQRTRQRLVQRLRDAGIRDERVLEVMLNTPRHLFVDEALASRAYEDCSLPIGFGQTISQPYVVARMSEQLCAGRRLTRVLEIGTGSGYQTAILAQLTDQVFSIERVRHLVDIARSRLRTLGLTNVRMKHGDGYIGWDYHAPFDGVLLTAAPPSLPQALLDSVAEGGRLVAPIGAGSAQELMVLERRGPGWIERRLEAVSFVPLIGGIV